MMVFLVGDDESLLLCFCLFASVFFFLLKVECMHYLSLRIIKR